MKPAIVAEIENLLGIKMSEAPARGDDPVSGVMPFRKSMPFRYALRDGHLAGLNLTGAKLNDQKWKAVRALNGFNAERIEALNLRDNKLKISPIEGMTSLRHLDLSQNELADVVLPPGIAHRLKDILVYDNPPLASPSPEIVRQGKNAILEYYRQLDQQGTEKIYEAKLLILGAGGAGKTTLARRLMHGMEAKMPTEHESTHGIEIHPLVFTLDTNRKFRAHLWDFGGQEIYHATHQFFLTKRSLYILVADVRKEDTDFGYWLQIIELLSDKSPVIIVQNFKGGRTKDLNFPGLRERFPNIVELHSLDLSDDAPGLQKLNAAIEYHLKQLPHIGETLPKIWADVRKALERIKEDKPYISLERYLTVCAEQGMEEEDRALFLSQYLHDLGFFLHFSDDPILKHTVVLRNEWATDGVYSVLDNADVIRQKGHFDPVVAAHIWEKEEYKRMHNELLQLMLKFELCYRIPDVSQKEEYIAPQLLSASEPETAIQWAEKDNLQLRYQYDFIPKGMISRLIVRLHRYIRDVQRDAWKTGVVLHRTNARAKMTETLGVRNIHIRASGAEAKELLTIMAEEVDRLNSTYHNLQVKKLVPCNCSECHHDTEPYFHAYDKLLRARERGRATVQCERSFEDVNVLRLIDNVFVTNFFKPKALKLFISYSKRDKEHLEDLKSHLAPLKREESILTWDDGNILPGEEWDKSIRRELSTADVIILLVSADFMATEYIWKEIDIAIQRHESGEALVIPVIVRPCSWEFAPFARFNALPEKGRPVTKWENKDEAWQTVVQHIRRLSEKQKNDAL